MSLAPSAAEHAGDTGSRVSYSPPVNPEPTDVPDDLSPHARRNRDSWNDDADAYQERNGALLEAGGGMAWGVWQIPEAELGILGDVRDRDVLELGCGAAQWSIALAKAGARPVGLDLSERQLEHARTLMSAAGVDFPLIHASAERVPLPDASFDVVFCDHGAMTFADPYLTVPEVARLLRPGGLFAFNHGSPILSIAWAADDERAGDRLVSRLLRDAPVRLRGLGRLQPALWRVDSAVPRQWLQHRGPDRTAPSGRREEHLPRRPRA